MQCRHEGQRLVTSSDMPQGHSTAVSRHPTFLDCFPFPLLNPVTSQQLLASLSHTVMPRSPLPLWSELIAPPGAWSLDPGEAERCHGLGAWVVRGPLWEATSQDIHGSE